MFYAVTGLFSPLATDADRAQWEKNNEEVMDLSEHAHLGDTTAPETPSARTA
jgi:NhaC family Na+:H+ antiporter